MLGPGARLAKRLSSFHPAWPRHSARLAPPHAPDMVAAPKPLSSARPMQAGKPTDHPTVKVPKVGVLLLNLGTPDSPDYWPMRRYLGEFLSDRRVIETNPVLWQVILQGIILNVRPQKS